MKKSLYTFGAGFIALMGLTSFNPLAESIRLASLESSASFAATSPPAAKVPSTPAASPTAVDTLLKKNYSEGVGKFTGKPGFKFSNKNGSYYITEISVNSVTTGGNNDSSNIDLIGQSNNTVTTTQVQVCLKEASATQGQVCTDCTPIPEICGPVNIDFEKLKSTDPETANREILSMRDQAKILVDKQIEIEKEKILAAQKQKENCEYYKDAAKKIKNESKILDCVVDNYKNSDDPKIRAKFARKFKSMVMSMAKNGDYQEIQDMFDGYEITFQDRELFKSLTTASRYAAFMAPQINYFDRYEGGFKTLNMPEYYQYRLRDVMAQAQYAELYTGQPLNKDLLAKQIDSLTKEFSLRVTQSLGQPTSNDPWGMTGPDYREVFSGYLSEIPMMTLGEGYTSVLNLIQQPGYDIPGLDTGLLNNSILNSRISGNPSLDSGLCYDPSTGLQVQCSQPRLLDTIGVSNQNGRGRGGISNPQQWWNAAQSIQPGSQNQNGFINQFFK